MRMQWNGGLGWGHVILALTIAFLSSATCKPRFPGHYGRHTLLDENTTMGLKVYVYDMPSLFNKGVVEKDMRCLSHMFATEIRIHLSLLSSYVRTLDPNEANWFYTPVYTACDLTPQTGLPLIDDMPYMMKSAIEYISTHWPYWNKTNGADHFFVVPHDYGACFHFQEREAVKQGILPLLNHATLLQTFGQKNHPCLKKNSIVIPPYVSLKKILNLYTVTANTPRSTFVYFRGVFYDVDNDPEGGHYARGVRASIWEKFKDNPLFDISSNHPTTYYEDMQRSIFCLCPLGWAPWSPRIVEAVVLGCIPVIIADDIVLPFGDVVPWQEIAIFVEEKDVLKLDTILASIDMETVTMKQKLLSEPSVKRALLFPRVAQHGDGFHQVLNALAKKLPHDIMMHTDSSLHWTSGPLSDFAPRRS